MAGRHSAGTSGAQTARRRPGRLLTVLVVVLALAAVAAAGYLSLHDRTKSAAAASAGNAQGPCTGTVTVPVVVTPAVEPAVRTVAQRWAASRPAVDGRCASAQVTAQASAAAVPVIAHGPRAMLWIPDSTVWSGLLTSGAPALAPAVTVGASIGTSPIVVAAASGHSAALNAVASHGWAAVMTSGAPATLSDPTTTSAGALVALALQAGAGSAPGASATLVGAFVRLAATAVPATAAGLSALLTHPGSAPAFTASEQDVFASNHGRSSAAVTAVYPTGPTPVLDFPVVRVVPTGTDATVAAAATRFTAELSTPRARQDLAAAGIRDPSGSPLAATAGSGIAARSVTALPAPTATSLTSAARLWRAATKPSRLLAVIDVSGSMAEDAGNGQSKIAIAAGAAQTAMTLVPDDWTLGLWSFSVAPPPATDWTEVVPLRPVRDQRQSFAAAAGTLPARVGGDTALYDTALAAFQAVTSSYDPSSVNVVALLTDGAEVDPDGIDLPTLLARLKASYNPAKPVHIVTIGIGSGADLAALRQISAATQGQTYAVSNPGDIKGVLLDSIVANN